MHYEGNIIRPPSEANSIILQITIGCSHNRCTFCGAYRDKIFRLKEESLFMQDIEFAANYCKHQKTVFLADGNVLAIPQNELVNILKSIRKKIPWVRRISSYANCRDILKRSVDEILILKNLGLGRIYMGLESGHDPTLQAICKGVGGSEMIAAAQKVKEAGIFLSVTCLLGIAGKSNSHDHARCTAAVLNEMKPDQIAVLTLMLLNNTPLAEQARKGTFQLPGRKELFEELYILIQDLELERAQFQANHSSNYFPLSGRLPRDKEMFINIINEAIKGNYPLKSERLRAL